MNYPYEFDEIQRHKSNIFCISLNCGRCDNLDKCMKKIRGVK